MQALVKLGSSLAKASDRILSRPEAGLAAPRVFPKLVLRGTLWLKEGRYWISYSAGPPPVMTGVRFETTDIPGRVADCRRQP